MTGAGELSEWEAAGRPEPIAADEIEGMGQCAYETCDTEADWLVEFETDSGTRTATKMCQPCSRENRVYVLENDVYLSNVRENLGGVHPVPGVVYVYTRPDTGFLSYALEYEIAYQEAIGVPSWVPEEHDDDHEETPDIRVWSWEVGLDE